MLAESLQPESYSVTISFTFDQLVLCSDLDDLKQAFQAHVISGLPCVVENSTCSAKFNILECSNQKKKRDTMGTGVELLLQIELISNASFDLVEYYASSKSTFSRLVSIQNVITVKI